MLRQNRELMDKVFSTYRCNTYVHQLIWSMYVVMSIRQVGMQHQKIKTMGKSLLRTVTGQERQIDKVGHEIKYSDMFIIKRGTELFS